MEESLERSRDIIERYQPKETQKLNDILYPLKKAISVTTKFFFPFWWNFCFWNLTTFCLFSFPSILFITVVHSQRLQMMQ